MSWALAVVLAAPVVTGAKGRLPSMYSSSKKPVLGKIAGLMGNAGLMLVKVGLKLGKAGLTLVTVGLVVKVGLWGNAGLGSDKTGLKLGIVGLVTSPKSKV